MNKNIAIQISITNFNHKLNYFETKEHKLKNYNIKFLDNVSIWAEEHYKINQSMAFHTVWFDTHDTQGNINDQEGVEGGINRIMETKGNQIPLKAI